MLFRSVHVKVIVHKNSRSFAQNNDDSVLQRFNISRSQNNMKIQRKSSRNIGSHFLIEIKRRIGMFHKNNYAYINVTKKTI